jgi:hypothetical protein
MNHLMKLLSCRNMEKELGQQRNAADWFLFVPYRPWVLGRGFWEQQKCPDTNLHVNFECYNVPTQFLGHLGLGL